MDINVKLKGIADAIRLKNGDIKQYSLSEMPPEILKFRDPTFTYTGSHIKEPLDADGNWEIRFFSSGKLTFSSLGNASKGIDVFCVGGGGGGSIYSGGGGGYTTTKLNVAIYPDHEYTITVGGRGAFESDGGKTIAFGASAMGGKGAVGATAGDGGSGGGKWQRGDGGSNGADGGNSGGTGQYTKNGIRTRKFNESDGKIYAGGGGAGADHSGKLEGGKGGTGGGGAGAYFGHPPTLGVNGLGGGGGGGNNYDVGDTSGGSGVVIIRNSRGV